MKLLIQVFDVFGEKVKNYPLEDYFASLESDLDRQLRAADAKLGWIWISICLWKKIFGF